MNFTYEYAGKLGSSTDFDTVQRMPLGTRAIDRFGRSYRYINAGAVALVAGNVLQGQAVLPNHLANTPPAVALAGTDFSYTPGATAAGADYYKDGILQVDTTPGNGLGYGIRTHLAITASTAFQLFLETDDPVQVALTTASRVGLIPSLYRGVIQCPVTTATATVCGVAVSAIPALGFGWALTWGPAPVLINGTPALGALVVGPSATTAGAVDVITTTNLVTAQIVGKMMQVGVSTKNNAVYVMLAQ